MVRWICPWSRRRAALLGALVGLLTPVAAARAQQVQLAPLIPMQPPPMIESAPPPDLPPRPRMSLGVGMGACLDSTGFSDGTHAIPAFFAGGGFGDGLAGFELGAFASSASGRYPVATAAPVDRLALDAFGVLRPAARVRPDDLRYGFRVLRAVAAELGLGYERDGRTTGAATRWVIHTGARVDFPLLPPGLVSELRLRLAYRRAIGLYTPEVTGGTTGPSTAVGDSNELYAALVTVF
ncbi:MAG TPA: hypothetical protein VMT03_16030 [Polyangia bacterium]|nr:hypothetical protein [Polyangia bacterium]